MIVVCASICIDAKIKNTTIIKKLHQVGFFEVVDLILKEAFSNTALNDKFLTIVSYC
jgi:hypothetical protein